MKVTFEIDMLAPDGVSRAAINFTVRKALSASRFILNRCEMLPERTSPEPRKSKKSKKTAGSS